jgi:acyl dehydratase
VAALRGLRNVVFKRPVPIGMTIHVEAEVAGLRALDEAHGLVELSLRVRDGDGRLLMRANVDALWCRAHPHDAPRPGRASANGTEPDLAPIDGDRVVI